LGDGKKQLTLVDLAWTFDREEDERQATGLTFSYRVSDTGGRVREQERLNCL
jgi:hypothetical protein